jgi:hypothetical protein
LAHMSISTYFRPNIHQNGPEILGVNHNNQCRTFKGLIQKLQNFIFCVSNSINFNR